uniref:Uncharacterized protein n=1 Tax=Arundo donax TaxID=35708 RepID=A0A0A9G270_ARUDO
MKMELNYSSCPCIVVQFVFVPLFCFSDYVWLPTLWISLGTDGWIPLLQC